VICLVDLPRPVHGMANINKVMIREFVASGLTVKIINTVPSYAWFLFPGKPWTVYKILHTLFCYIRFFIHSFSNIGGVVYRPINGGVGQVYDLVYLVLARIFRNKIFIHHHAFDYINKYKILFYLINFVAGERAVHIILGDEMGEGLSKLYQIEKQNFRIVSNLAFFEQSIVGQNESHNNKIQVGYLANLSIEKGVDSFADVCRSLKSIGVDFEAKIAGPFSNSQSEKIVRLIVNDIDGVRYVGPLYGEKKKDFYQSLDCFIFPSKNEAEPLVLYEAALFGAYLAGTRYGCMQSMINGLRGFSVVDGRSVARDIAHAVQEALLDNAFSCDNRNVRVECFNNQRNKAKQFLSSFINELGTYELSKTG